jgi:hypothetical protein
MKKQQKQELKSIAKQVKENQQHDLKMELLSEYVDSVKRAKPVSESETMSALQKMSGYFGNTKYRNRSYDDIEREKHEVGEMVAKISRAVYNAIDTGAVTVGQTANAAGAKAPTDLRNQTNPKLTPDQPTAPTQPVNPAPPAAPKPNFAQIRQQKQAAAAKTANAQSVPFSKTRTAPAVWGNNRTGQKNMRRPGQRNMNESQYEKLDVLFESILNLSENTKPTLTNYIIGIANSYTHGAASQPQFQKTIAEFAQKIEQAAATGGNILGNLFKSKNSIGGLLTSLCKVMYSSMQVSQDAMQGGYNHTQPMSNNPFVNQVDIGISKMDGKKNAKDLFNIATASIEKLADADPAIAQRAINAMTIYTRNKQKR